MATDRPWTVEAEPPRPGSVASLPRPTSEEASLFALEEEERRAEAALLAVAEEEAAALAAEEEEASRSAAPAGASGGLSSLISNACGGSGGGGGFGAQVSTLVSFAKLKSDKRRIRWGRRGRAKLKHKSAKNLLDTGNVVTELNEDDDDVDWSLQADASLNTLDAFAQRQELRDHSLVCSELERWWLAIIACARKRDGRGASTINYSDYSKVYLMLFAELLEEEVSCCCCRLAAC